MVALEEASDIPVECRPSRRPFSLSVHRMRRGALSAVSSTSWDVNWCAEQSAVVLAESNGSCIGRNNCGSRRGAVALGRDGGREGLVASCSILGVAETLAPLFIAKRTPWPLVRKLTIPTDRPPLVEEI
jgi:hypothetical protein